MMLMSVTIEVHLPEDLIPVLDQKARGAGLGRDEYLCSIVSRDLMGAKRLDEVLAGFRKQVEASGVTDAELADLFSAARDDAHNGRRSGN